MKAPKERFVMLTGPLTFDNAAQCMESLFLLSSASSAPITLVICSEGGDLGASFALHDAIRSIGAPVIGVVYAQCFSCAVLVLQACDLRVMAPMSALMFHEGSLDAITAPDLKEAYAEVQAMRADEDMYWKAVADRTGLSVKDIQTLEARCTYLTAAQSREWKFIDLILEGSVWALVVDKVKWRSDKD